MSTYLTRDGKYLGVDPAIPETVYADRAHGGAWEDVLITDHGATVDVRFLAANRQLTITPEGQLETRPAGAVQSWESFTLTTVAGRTFLERAGVRLVVEGYQPVTPAVPIHLEQRGHDFVDAQGQRIVYAGVDAFLALRQYLDGGAAALEPFFAESTRLGFQVWRIWSQGSKAQNGVIDLRPTEPGYDDHIRPFVDLLNSRGIIPLLTAYVDNQDVQSPISHWSQLADRVRGSSTLLSGFNQWSKNKSTFTPWDLPMLDGIIWSRGSDVDDTITEPKGAPASELHATRVSFDRALMDATASPPYMRAHGGGMVWMTEGQPFGDGNSYTERQAWELGRGYSILWSLAVYHNRQSQKGELMHDDTARCAAEWVRGLTLSPAHGG